MARHSAAGHLQPVRLHRPATGREAPATLDHVVMYPPVVAFNGVAAIAFMGGFVTLGIALSKSRTFSGWSGVLVPVGAPMPLIGARVAQLAAPGLWFVAVLGAAALGAGLALWFTDGGAYRRSMMASAPHFILG